MIYTHRNSLTMRIKSAVSASILALATVGQPFAAMAQDDAAAAAAKKDPDPASSVKTASPIKHVIILIGENRGLDHTFGVYKPKGKGQTISNLLSKGIVNEDGTAGPNFKLAQQYSVSAQPSW